jgi:hypothetical protein
LERCRGETIRRIVEIFAKHLRLQRVTRWDEERKREISDGFGLSRRMKGCLAENVVFAGDRRSAVGFINGRLDQW